MIRCPASQSAVEIEDGILAFLREEEPKTSADRPLLRGTPDDAEPWREVIVIGRNQPVTHSTVSGKLQLRGPRSIGAAGGGGPIRLVAEIDALVKIPATRPDVNGMLTLIGQTRDRRNPVVIELDIYAMAGHVQQRLSHFPPQAGG